jgi:hypothetical protein
MADHVHYWHGIPPTVFSELDLPSHCQLEARVQDYARTLCRLYEMVEDIDC